MRPTLILIIILIIAGPSTAFCESRHKGLESHDKTGTKRFLEHTRKMSRAAGHDPDSLSTPENRRRRIFKLLTKPAVAAVIASASRWPPPEITVTTTRKTPLITYEQWKRQPT